MPKSKLAKIGVWQGEAFIGSLIFGVGSNNQMARSVGVADTQCCELVRVALQTHTAPVSRIVAIALRFIKRQYPGLRCVVSYADPGQGHVGTIYQAGNWIYTGCTAPVDYYEDSRGQLNHWRDARRMQQRGVSLKRIYFPGKHKYLMPLDEEMRRKIAPLAKPYPKRAQGVAGCTPVVQTGGGGSSPTCALVAAD